jgi:hypothetical protein
MISKQASLKNAARIAIADTLSDTPASSKKQAATLREAWPFAIREAPHNSAVAP